jgi:hypothetical protein
MRLPQIQKSALIDEEEGRLRHRLNRGEHPRNADPMRDGRFKVAAHLADWFDEFRGYHRKDGLIVKLNDDLMSATRIAVMARRHAKDAPFGAKAALSSMRIVPMVGTETEEYFGY